MPRPAPAAMLHAGVLKKFGLYGLPRLALPFLPDGAQHWSGLLLVLLLANIISHWFGHDRATPPRLDARLFQRHAHGLYFSRHRQCEYSRYYRCGDL